jgi:hypothetical protein
MRILPFAGEAALSRFQQEAARSGCRQLASGGNPPPDAAL